MVILTGGVNSSACGLSEFTRHGRIINNSSGGGVKDTWIVNLSDK